MNNLTAKERLIVALDVPTQEEALDLVKKLDNVSFFKIGMLLLFTGQVMSLINTLKNERNGQVFLDIKWGGDISNTTTDFMQACINSTIVKFITLIEAESKAFTKQTLESAKAVRRASKVEYPHFLMVPYFSSLDSSDLKQTQGTTDLDQYIYARGQAMLDLGCDGLIVSGDAIKLCREKFGDQIDIVSPGIRPAWSSQDDHKRFTTPSRAIELGANYLVVGRPIIGDPNPRDKAQRIIEEIEEAVSKKEKHSPSSGSRGQSGNMALAAKSQN